MERDLRPKDCCELTQLMGVLQQATLDSNGTDKLVWTPVKSGLFSVKSFTMELDKLSPFKQDESLVKIWQG